jgi:hypothetical protein
MQCFHSNVRPTQPEKGVLALPRAASVSPVEKGKIKVVTPPRHAVGHTLDNKGTQ